VAGTGAPHPFGLQNQIECLLEEMRIVHVLQTLNEAPNGRALFGNKSKRLKDMESDFCDVFRFTTVSGIVAGPMKYFLNR
jgi:hypothetical protein